MLDIGGWEFLIVAFVLIMVVGPKELPNVLRGFTRIIRQVRSMASEFSRGMQNMADDAELSDIKGTFEDVKSGNLSGVADAIDPGGNLKDSVEDLKTSARETSLREDVDQIKDLAGTTGDGIVETVNKPSSSGDPATEAVGSNPKTRN
jgi:sec-independent protein translocase protein TatB